MILYHEYGNGLFVAQLFDGAEPEFDTAMEAEQNAKAEAGDRTGTPPPPYARYGPGSIRWFKPLSSVSYLDASGDPAPTLRAAVTSLQSKKVIRSAEKRIARAKAKLEFEERRMAALLSPQRVFHPDTGEERKP